MTCEGATGLQDYGDAHRELSDEAIAWIVRLRSGETSLADHDAFVAWRLRSPDHESAAWEAERLWCMLGPAGDAERSGRKRRSRRAVLGGAAGLLALAGSVYGLGGTSGIATGIAERRTLTLEEGSAIHMNAATRIRPSFSGSLRLLRLDAGQATFMVAKDNARPFVVETSRGRIQAIGTVFDVNLGSEADTISVLEGRVRVEGDQSGSFELAAGQGERIGASSAPVAPLNVKAETAWRQGRLRFDARPLGEVVAELGRYRSEPILVLDPKLKALSVTGSFRLDDPESVLSAIEATLAVRVHRLPFVTLIR